MIVEDCAIASGSTAITSVTSIAAPPRARSNKKLRHESVILLFCAKFVTVAHKQILATLDDSEILDEDQIEELNDYFMEAESPNIDNAIIEFEEFYEEEEIRLYRIKFISDIAN